MNKTKKTKKRIVVLKIFFITIASVIVFRAFDLARGRDPRLVKLAQRQFTGNITKLPRRGLIFDRNGEGLAVSLKVRSLFLRPDVLKKEFSHEDLARLAKGLSKILKISFKDLLNKVHSSRSFVWVERQLNLDAEAKIKESGLLDYGDGIGMVEEAKRFYPNGELASHVLGTVGVDGKGLEGLELFYENFLKGEQLKIESTKDATGRRIFQDEKGLTSLIDGKSLILTLDKSLQYSVEKHLKEAVLSHQARSGSIIVAEVSSGDVLAMANFPTYDPNRAGDFPLASRRNRLVSDLFEPGSIFKPLIVGMALEAGKSYKTKVYCEEGNFKVKDRRIREAETHEKFGLLTYEEVLKYSSNIGAAKIAMELGVGGLGDLIFNKLQLDKKTNIDLPGEASGLITQKQLKSVVKQANVGFGQGLASSGIQMLSYYLALANKGIWVKPKMVRAILSESPDSLEKGSILYRLYDDKTLFDSEKRRIFSEKTAHRITQMLTSVTEPGGTGEAASLEDWVIAGKTGTAQKIDPKTRHYSREKYVASFAGYAPAENPKVVAIVILDEPSELFYASQTAAPLFRDVMQAALLRMNVEPETQKVKIQQMANRAAILSAIKKSEELQNKLLFKNKISKNPFEQTQAQHAQTDSEKSLNENSVHKNPDDNAGGQNRRVFNFSGNTPISPLTETPTVPSMPDLEGKTIRESLKVFLGADYKLKIKGSGYLVQQQPLPGDALEPGAEIQLVFSDIKEEKLNLKKTKKQSRRTR